MTAALHNFGDSVKYGYYEKNRFAIYGIGGIDHARGIV